MLRNQTQAAKLRARELRKARTLPERLLWHQLRKSRCGFKVRTQHPLGDYTLDFFILEALLCIEVDGKWHEMRVDEDIERDQILESLGVKTIRVSAQAVLGDPEEVAFGIYLAACERVGREPGPRW